MKTNYHLSKNLLETEAPIFVDGTNNMSIWISKSKYYIPYFILYNSSSIETATKVCRINCHRSEYVCIDDVDFPEWILSINEKMQLILLLNKERYPGVNTWNYIKNEYIKYCGWDYEKEQGLNITMPDYLNIIKPHEYLIYRGEEEYNFHLSKLLGEEQWDQYIASRNTESNLMVMVFPSPHIDPYVIVYNDFCARATKSCRICLYEAKYLYAGDTDINESALTDHEVDQLLQIFTPDLWESAVENYLFYLRENYKLSPVQPENLTMPDYNLLKGCKYE